MPGEHSVRSVTSLLTELQKVSTLRLFRVLSSVETRNCRDAFPDNVV